MKQVEQIQHYKHWGISNGDLVERYSIKCFAFCLEIYVPYKIFLQRQRAGRYVYTLSYSKMLKPMLSLFIADLTAERISQLKGLDSCAYFHFKNKTI